MDQERDCSEEIGQVLVNVVQNRHGRVFQFLLICHQDTFLQSIHWEWPSNNRCYSWAVVVEVSDQKGLNPFDYLVGHIDDPRIRPAESDLLKATRVERYSIMLMIRKIGGNHDCIYRFFQRFRK